MKTRKRPRTFIVSFYILVLIFLVLSVFLGNQSFETQGNTAANFGYTGIAAEADGWIYTIDPYWEYKGLYAVKSDGSESFKLFDGECSYINVVGDWVYFIHYYRYTGTTLYKIPKGGGKAVALLTGVVKMIVVDDWIYYQDGNTSGLDKIRTDGTGKTRIINEAATLFDVRGGWIYFLQYEQGTLGHSLYRVRLGGGEKKLIAEGLGSPVTDGTWIYYTKYDNTHYQDFATLARCRMDGSWEEILTDAGSKPFIDGEWIYFNGQSGIYRMKTDGTEKSKISDSRYVLMNSTTDWLIYREYEVYYSGSSYVLYKMHKDGSDVSPFWADPGSYEE